MQAVSQSVQTRRDHRLSRSDRQVGHLLATLFVVIAATPVLGTITLTPPAHETVNLTLAPDGDSISLLPAQLAVEAEGSSQMQQTLASRFGGWTFHYGTQLNGTLNVVDYDAASLGAHNGGAMIDATYTPGAGDPALANLRFIQFVDTTQPLAGWGNPKIDTIGVANPLPFYPMPAPAGGQIMFHDFSNRNCMIHPNIIHWNAELLLASLDAYDPATLTGTVTVYDGIDWGWQFLCHAAPAVPGDANHDGDVDFADLLIVAQHFGQQTELGSAVGDFDNDGSVGFDDLLILAQNYGQGEPGGNGIEADGAASQVPEPLLPAFTCATIGLLTSRRR